jgi:hypothetical protein
LPKSHTYCNALPSVDVDAVASNVTGSSAFAEAATVNDAVGIPVTTGGVGGVGVGPVVLPEESPLHAAIPMLSVRTPDHNILRAMLITPCSGIDAVTGTLDRRDGGDVIKTTSPCSADSRNAIANDCMIADSQIAVTA